jgi:ABC-2 type transport system permease protein
MFEIIRKEIRGFLSSLIAYVVMLVFLIATGLFNWVLPDINIFDNGYANLDSLFGMAPWLLVFLISAITMKSFSEEKKNGTIELLTTKPVSDLEIILGKYFAGILLVLFTILPTLIYWYSIDQLSVPKGNIDTGALLGSYLGLFLISSCFVAIGIFASLISENQIVSFVSCMFICFALYWIFDLIADFKLLGKFDSLVSALGIQSHYQSISRGVLDSRDLIYFLSINCLFISAGKLVFGSRKW